MSNLNINFSSALKTELGQPGVWAYLVWFDKDHTTPQWTTLVSDGNVGSGTTQVALPASLDSGKFYLLVQSQDPSKPETLPSAIQQQSDINAGNATALDFRYDSLELTLDNSGYDSGNLTSVNGFGFPMELSVTTQGTNVTTSVGYAINGSQVASEIETISPGNTQKYTAGPLDGTFRAATGPADGAPFSADDWKSYVESFEGDAAKAIKLTGTFNGAPDAEGVWHNGGYFAYQLEWDATEGVFWLSPLDSSQIGGYIKLPPSVLENSIYATTESVGIYDSKLAITPFATINAGANNQWGKVLSKLFTGFNGGYVGSTGKVLNPQSTGTVDLSASGNWDPSYAYGSADVTNPRSYQYYDKYSAIFYQNTNSYGSNYSDALMSQYSTGGPLLSMFDPTTNKNYTEINLTLFADSETPTGYTTPKIANYLAPESSAGYDIPTVLGAPNVVLYFGGPIANNSGIVLASTATVTLRILSSDTANTPVWKTVTIDGSKAGSAGLWQNFVIEKDADGNYTARANNPTDNGSLTLSNLPVPENGRSWYQIEVGGKTYNLYTTTKTTGGTTQFVNGAAEGGAPTLAVDGLASLGVPPAGLVGAFTVNFVSGDTVTFDAADTVWRSAAEAGGSAPKPWAPVAGFYDAGSKTFTAFAGQTTAQVNSVTTTYNDISFTWTGTNPVAKQSINDAAPWIKSYTNKIDAGSVAYLTITDATTHTVLSDHPKAVANLDGEWQTDSIHLAVGTYTVSFAEYQNLDTGYTTPMTQQSYVLTLTVEALCFLRGTGILTPSGEVAVEALSVGDTVVTASGKRRRIAWIGRGRVLSPKGQRTPATPVIVRRGAIAENVPHRDLHVTKGHALSFHGALIPVEFLVNHRSIVWDDRGQVVEVFHIELETHDVLVANGAPAESFRDDGNRWLFQNANTAWGLAPLPSCAPVLTGGPLVDAVWRQLLLRSGQKIDLLTTDDPDLHLMVDGRRIDGRATRTGHVFPVPADAQDIRVASRAAEPDVLGLARDPRRLGVAIRRMIAWRGAQLRVVDADDARLNEGWHAYEPDNAFRWTDGQAALPRALFEGLNGTIDLEIEVAGTAGYPVERLACAA